MQLKVFRFKNGQLSYIGIREVQSGDVIVEGETPQNVRLQETKAIKELNDHILATLPEDEKADFLVGLEAVGLRDSSDISGSNGLRDAFRRLNPKASEYQLDVMVAGRALPSQAVVVNVLREGKNENILAEVMASLNDDDRKTFEQAIRKTGLFNMVEFSTSFDNQRAPADEVRASFKKIMPQASDGEIDDAIRKHQAGKIKISNSGGPSAAEPF